MGDEIKENPGSYIGDGGQVRLDPVRQLKWGREGIHFALGLFVALLPLVAVLWGTVGLMWAMLAMQPVAVLLFIAYEVTEGWRLNDWSYRDIGGFMGGWVFGLTLFLMGSILLFQSL